jgi:hypothetical protein
MTEKRIILANGSRLTRGLLNRVLSMTVNLKVVGEIIEHGDLPAAISQLDADWVVITLPIAGSLPQWVNKVMDEHPEVNFMTISADCSQVRTKQVQEQKELDGLSLEDLIVILEKDPGQFG